jgi:hypothetical protein
MGRRRPSGRRTSVGRARVIENRVDREVGGRCGELANAEEATAVVMRHGYQRGERFEGCECAAGEGACEARFRPGFRELETQRILFGTGVQ